ncbi:MULTISPECIES: helix-turn-helix transcriptional regulator [Sporomusa]|uniref:helix-turn-helix domain-containing protein n=1 Tax=Sporomusa TaxID=2375 RepID=UPI00166DFA67|nr:MULTISPECIES: helix-turn-helix transcriptional regulator [Sporomusa]HML35640.1 helix-turn-helix transcriptional regulator [Sporomusa sphaeroides]
MRLNSARVQQLLDDHNLNRARLARQMGISRGALSNALAGRRTVGKKLLAGLIRAFPDETIETLTLPDRQVTI